MLPLKDTERRLFNPDIPVIRTIQTDDNTALLLADTMAQRPQFANLIRTINPEPKDPPYSIVVCKNESVANTYRRFNNSPLMRVLNPISWSRYTFQSVPQVKEIKDSEIGQRALLLYNMRTIERLQDPHPLLARKHNDPKVNMRLIAEYQDKANRLIRQGFQPLSEFEIAVMVYDLVTQEV